MGGYVVSALLLNSIHMRFGQRGIAAIGSCSHLVAYIGVCNHPPYPVLVVLFILAGFGTGAFGELVSQSKCFVSLTTFQMVHGTPGSGIWQTQMKSLVSYMLFMA